MLFDRARAHGKRLDIPSGTAVRFEPGDSKTVTLVSITGHQIISGGNSLASGALDHTVTNDTVDKLILKKFRHKSEPNAVDIQEDTTIGREDYAAMFGPTVGDKVRLGDTALWIEVERDMVCDQGSIGLYVYESGNLDCLWRRSEVRWRQVVVDPHRDQLLIRFICIR